MGKGEVPEANRFPAGQLAEELIQHISRQGSRVPIPVFLAAALIAAFAVGSVTPVLWVSWLVVVAIVLIIRWVILKRLPAMTGIKISKRLKIAIILSGINGVVHGMSLLFFPYLSDFQRAIQSMMLVGLCAGSVATTVGYMPVFLAYLIPTLVPLCSVWVAFSIINDYAWTEAAVALLVGLFGVVLVALGRDAYRSFKESFEIRFQHMQLNKQLQNALKVAESASRSKTRFLASASHDLRQPIHTLSLFGAALAMRPLDDKSREIALHMDDALQALATQLDALLDVSKLDAGVVDVNIGKINLYAHLLRLQQDFEASAKQKGIVITFECPTDAVVLSDEVLLERIIRNLLSNAVKYTEKGKISVIVLAEDQHFCVTVKDTGSGIAEEEQEQIFEEFYQINNPERDRSKGLGLGLAIVKRLADLLGLEIEMQSATGEGTEFTFCLPAANSKMESTAMNTDEEDVLKNLHALVVDDEKDVGLGMKTLLEALGCKVSLADSTRIALDRVREEKPSVILADFRLRGNDNGIDTVQSIRKIYPEIPAILISGDTAPDRIQQAQLAGIEMLHKPVIVDDLKRAIAAVCKI